MENENIDIVLEKALNSLDKLFKKNEEKNNKEPKGVFWDDAFQQEIPLTLADGLLTFFELEKAVLNNDIWKYKTLEEIVKKGTMKLAKKVTDKDPKNKFRATYSLSKDNIRNYNERDSDYKIDLQEKFSFSYGLILSALSAALESNEIRFSKDDLSDIKSAANLLAESLIDGTYKEGGWSWHLDEPSSLNHEYPDIYSSYMACLGLSAWRNTEVGSKEKMKKAGECCLDTVDWILDTANTQSEKGMWAENGSNGRYRFLDLVLAMSILAEHADDATLSDYDSIVFRGLDDLVFNFNPTPHQGGTYHRFQSDSLRTQLVMEELGGPYFELLFWGTLLNRFSVKQNSYENERTESNTRARRRQKRFMSEMREYCNSSAVKYNLFSLVDDVISRRETANEDWKFLWEKNEKRFYLTGLATLSLALVQKIYTQFKEEYSDQEYILQNEIASTLQSPRFSDQFAAQVLRSLSRRTLSK